jgi:tRNA uridine 5-carboxymethylaminomethyl modification enzyme
MVSDFDVVVVGGGHAGCEAARACARMGLRTAMITMNADLIAQMSCNPAIGGIAKGHLVREIDALGGVMGEVADAVGIQFRLLNTSRGPAVWSPRAQCDKKQYRVRMKQVLEAEPNIRIKQAEVAALVIEDGVVRGVRLTDGRGIRCGAVVITTGTFLNGLAHIGERKLACGRSGEAPSEILAEQIRNLNLGWTRLKTGTPPRLDGRTIDWSKFERQAGDAVPTPFSFMTGRIDRPQIECFMARTSAATRGAVLESIARSPLYSGQIEGIGPRYCPSIEDKFVKFPDKESHQIFLEPEGLDTHEIYVNGMSTSMPIDVQARMIASVPGLEDAEMIRPGYAIEYDAVDARELGHTLEVRKLPGLFLAGQINGTSGYEEAAGQGLMAGMNAARKIRGEAPVVLPRSEAYIGIMIDDLVTQGTDEPYRMFTSRAEHRLHLRIDNADERLTPIGREAGLVTNERWEFFEAKRKQVACLLGELKDSPKAAWLRRPESRIAELGDWVHAVLNCESLRGVLMTVETEVKYSGYLEQQSRQIERLRTSDRRVIPEGMEFSSIPGLSREVGEKLTRVRPATLGQAARIPGVTPAAVAILEIHLALGVRDVSRETKASDVSRETSGHVRVTV